MDKNVLPVDVVRRQYAKRNERHGTQINETQASQETTRRRGKNRAYEMELALLLAQEHNLVVGYESEVCFRPQIVFLCQSTGTKDDLKQHMRGFKAES